MSKIEFLNFNDDILFVFKKFKVTKFSDFDLVLDSRFSY